jgi:hypothetical protein
MDQPLTTTLGELAHTDAERLRKDLSAGTPSRPLLGVLPLRRVVPQDVHSVMDYVGGATLMAVGVLCDDPAARNLGLAVGGATIATSLLTDYRLSLAKVVPIEVHEAADYLVAATAIAGPFAFGYRSATARWLHAAVGVTTLVASLFTDYRAQTRR